MRALILALALALSAGPLAAQDSAPDPVQGAALFQHHCSVCHGSGALGDGPDANMLNPQPPNLTTLTARYGGVFPVTRVVMRIDGRDPLVAHGSPMPVYGAFFEGQPAPTKAETGQPIMTTQPILDLMAWLESVQVE